MANPEPLARRSFALGAGCVLACAFACAGPQQRSPAQIVSVAPARGSAGTEQLPPATQRPAARIREGAVDDIFAGKPIPPAHLDDNARYEARWVADAQPMEGFLIGAPPVWVTISDGPMKDVQPGPLEELTPVLAPKALAAARAGAAVAAIVVEQPGITTEHGIGVGSSYESLRAAYGPLQLVRSPEWLDARDHLRRELQGVARCELSARELRAGRCAGPREPRDSSATLSWHSPCAPRRRPGAQPRGDSRHHRPA